MDLSTLTRGSIVKAAFPFEDAPDRPGPFDHYCLFVDRLVSEQTELVMLAYGTSRMDDNLARRHGVGGGILSIDSKLVKGDRMGGPVTHFLARHVATVPKDWIDPKFRARLDFMRPETRQTDAHRQRMYRLFEIFEDVMDGFAHEATKHLARSGRIGLAPGSRLR